MILESARLIAAGIAALGFIGAGIGIGLIFKAMVEGIAKNPAEKDKIQSSAMLGFALTESIALFVLLTICLILFVM